MRKIIYTAIYADDSCQFQVEKEITQEEIALVTYDIHKGRHEEQSRICFKNLGEEFSSPFLSWYNLIFCSNNYGATPDYEYMNRAVQEGKKTVATVYLDPDSPEAALLVRELPDDCAALPYGSSMLFVFHKGSLSDYFDFAQVKAVYEKHGAVCVDWNKVKDYFKMDISSFGDAEICGFSLHSGRGKEEEIIIGLLLGYPIESTVAWMHI